MKKTFYFLAVIVIITVSSCRKDNERKKSCDLASSAVPAAVTGSCVNGYTSFTQVIDAYDGRILGTTWQSGRYLHLESNGKNAELYIMGGSQFSEYVTKAEGTVTFNEATGTFQFHVCSAHYKGWQNGQLTVNRAASESEKADMTQNLQFFYDFETSGGINYLQLVFVSTPQGSPTSFRKI
jgi:hypothetical protein